MTVPQPTKFVRAMGVWLPLLLCCTNPAASTSGALVTESYRLRASSPFARLANDRPELQVLEWSARPLIQNVMAASRWREPQDGREGWVVWTQDERLLWTTGGDIEELDRDVSSAPVVRGEWLAWAAHPQPGDLSLTVRWRGPISRDVPTPLFSLGALQFVDAQGTLVGIGAINGGVAGYQRVGDTFLCLTNCELRTGSAWHDFMPPSGEFSVVGADIEWQAEGQGYRVGWMP